MDNLIKKCSYDSQTVKIVRGRFPAFLTFKAHPKGTLLFYFLKLYNFSLNEIFVGSTGSELQHPWIAKIMCEPKNRGKNHF